jgi:hypothetical protein
MNRVEVNCVSLSAAIVMRRSFAQSREIVHLQFGAMIAGPASE